jgi:hypothetical protein
MYQCACGTSLKKKHIDRHKQTTKHQLYELECQRKQVEEARMEIKEKGFVQPLHALILGLYLSYEIDNDKMRCNTCRLRIFDICELLHVSLKHFLLPSSSSSSTSRAHIPPEYMTLLSSEKCRCYIDRERNLDSLHCFSLLNRLISYLCLKMHENDDDLLVDMIFLTLLVDSGELKEEEVNRAFEMHQYSFVLERLQQSYDQQQREIQDIAKRSLHCSTDIPTDLIDLVSDYIGPDWSIPQIVKGAGKNKDGWYIVEKK